MDYLSSFLTKAKDAGYLGNDQAQRIDNIIKKHKGIPEIVCQAIVDEQVLTQEQVQQIQIQLQQLEYWERFLKKLTIQAWLPQEKCDRVKTIAEQNLTLPLNEIYKLLVKERLLSDDQISQIQCLLEDENAKGSESSSNKSSTFYLRKVYKTYPTPEGPFQALKGIDLEIERGEFLGILGFSGSGKSTLLNILGLLSTPDIGCKIFYNGVCYQTLGSEQRDHLRRQKFGFIFQEANLLGHLTAIDNVALPLRLQERPHSECIERAKQILRSFMNTAELERADQFFAKKPSQLSGGQKQRVAAARAMVHDPEIIFADEPTGNLDLDTGQAVMECLKRAASEKGSTVVLVTHNPSQARQFCKRFLWMEDGVLVRKVSNGLASTMHLVNELSGKSLGGGQEITTKELRLRNKQ